ncbi:MAG: HAMP domain-containing protein [Phycisphaerae bacterium]|nr:HAMP domain-containing protein [Phycisphaerae bacterium]
MRRRLLAIAALMLAIVLAVTWTLLYELRANQADLTRLWSRTDTVNDAMRLAATQLGTIEAVWPRTSGSTTVVPDAPRQAIVGRASREIGRQFDRLTGLVSDDRVHRQVLDLRIILAEIHQQAAPAEPRPATAATSVARLRKAFDQLWMTLSELNGADAARVVLRQQHQADRFLVVIIAVVLVGSALVGYHIIRVSAVLDDFVAATQQLRRGQWSHRISTPPARELRVLADNFNEMAEELARAERRRTEAAQEMIVTLHHEVGNATASISALVQVLRRHEPELSPAVVSALTKIDDTVHRLTRTVSRLRDFPALHVADYPGGYKMFDVGDAREPEPAPRSSVVGPRQE